MFLLYYRKEGYIKKMGVVEHGGYLYRRIRKIPKSYLTDQQ